MADRARLAYVTAFAVGAGTAVYLLWKWWTRKMRHQPPKSWRKVGELSDMVVYPVKSLGPVRVSEMDCTSLGLRSGWLRDRVLMVIDLDGRFLTARQIPKMVQVSPSISGSVLTLRAPGMIDVSVDLSSLRGKSFPTAVWGQAVMSRDCGEEVARWLSRFLKQEDTGLRLVYYPLDYPTREVRSRNKIFPLLESDDSGAYPDETSYTLINETSVAEMNSRIEDEISIAQFRMNFIIKGAAPYAEDEWDWVRIGKIIFRNVRPCTRCVLTTINTDTAKKHPEVEPLRTLKTYRQITNPELRPFTGDSPMMGIHLALRGPSGTVRLGDPVFVGTTEKRPILRSPS